MTLVSSTQDREQQKFREVATGTPSVGMTLDATIAGEDLTNDVLKVEQRFSYDYKTAVGTHTISGTTSFLHGIFLTNPSAGGAIVVYDSASGTNANIVCSIGTNAITNFYPINVNCSSGIVVANVGTQTFTTVYR